MTRVHVLIAIMTIALLSGCAGALPWNDQNLAGITKLRVEPMQITEVVDGQPVSVTVCCSFVYESGKQGQITGTVSKHADGSWAVAFDSSVEAFGGQQARAELEQAVTSAAAEAFSRSVQTVVEGLKAAP